MSKSTALTDTALQSATSEFYLKAFSRGLTRAQIDAAVITLVADRLDNNPTKGEILPCLILLRHAL